MLKKITFCLKLGKSEKKKDKLFNRKKPEKDLRAKSSKSFVKFRYCENATKFEKIAHF